MVEEALEVATDPDYRFELAIQLGRIEVAKVNCGLTKKLIFTICMSLLFY